MAEEDANHTSKHDKAKPAEMDYDLVSENEKMDMERFTQNMNVLSQKRIIISTTVDRHAASR
jgi:hypothetical protein